MPGGPSPSGGGPLSFCWQSMLIDSHCHLTDERYKEDRTEVLARARDAGVRGVITICSHARDTDEVAALLRATHGDSRVPVLWGTAGIHPHDAQNAQPGDLDRVRAAAGEIQGVVAIGETGLDFFYDLSPRALQEELFRGQLEMAEELDLPVVVHSRSADKLMGEILRERGSRVRGVLHCFTGGKTLLRQALDVGWLVSFTGIITFKKYDGQELIRQVPRDRLMVETDGPYLAPVPYRGKRNEPAFVDRVAEALARIRGEDPEEVAGYTTRNAMEFFRLSM